MHGKVSHEKVVGVPASVTWEAYRGLELGRLVDELLPDVIGRVEVVEGDGGVGTIMKLIFPPGTPGVSYMKERFTKMDDENRIKETEVIEGGFKELPGFHRQGVRLEIIEKDSESSIIRSTIEYDVDDNLSDIASLLTTKPLEIIAEAIANYLTQNKPSA